MGSLFIALADLLHLLFTLFTYAVIARVLVSWLSVRHDSSLVAYLYKITEPVLAPIRKLIPPVAGLDLSPAAVILLIHFLDRFLVGTLRQLALT
ncbi:MAG TPA: YggT family protein [bacterium]|jgi:YggT family protein|nr:YggT family protein [bacterium]HNT65950.1 YggT family protein [bacterium]HOX86010.1 YggT family protein [bacterium]HPG45007.1 YggT family protein [bacterium]HPM97249.1 YggT family protein [bacterium]